MAKENVIRTWVRTAMEVWDGYDGSIPLAHYLRSFFAARPKLGSRDRKQITHLCYSAYRLGKSTGQMDRESAILAGQLMVSEQSNEVLAVFRPEWNARISDPVNAKLALLDIHLDDIFPWTDLLSAGMDADSFSASFFSQPDLFIRIRPGHRDDVITKLRSAGISFERVSDTCLALPNGSKLENVLDIDRETVIQDYSSQQTGTLLLNEKLKTINHKLAVWDCCAASGGKSIMAIDFLGNIDLTVSDIRESILANLKERFRRAGISNYRSYLLDLSTNNGQLPTDNFDLILADVPCTGSGTWSRTPEQLCFFNKESITYYAGLQRRILENAILRLKPGGALLYITCSVFESENEAQVRYLNGQHGLQVEKMDLIRGYDRRADTMFAALLQKPL